MGKKRKVIIFSLILSYIIIAGFSLRRDVDLLNDHKLIDLDLAIKDAKVGTEGSKNAPDEKDEAQEKKEADEEEVSVNKASTVPVRRAAKTYTIEIRNKTIKCNNEIQKDAEVLKKLLISEYKEGCAVNLVDDYAEAHVYKEVRAMLDSLKDTCGLEYGEK